MKLWKWLGVAGLTGVAATGAIIARNQRARAQLTPDQIRQRLHERVDAAEADGRDPGAQPVGGPGNPGSTESSARA
jgi:hypothetical protein